MIKQKSLQMLIQMFQLIKKIVIDCTTDTADGKFSYTKIAAIIAATIFSYKIIMMPNPTEEMMLIYMSTVGGLSTLNKLISMKLAPKA